MIVYNYVNMFHVFIVLNETCKTLFYISKFQKNQSSHFLWIYKFIFIFNFIF